MWRRSVVAQQLGDRGVVGVARHVGTSGRRGVAASGGRDEAHETAATEAKACLAALDEADAAAAAAAAAGEAPRPPPPPPPSLVANAVAAPAAATAAQWKWAVLRGSNAVCTPPRSKKKQYWYV